MTAAAIPNEPAVLAPAARRRLYRGVVLVQRRVPAMVRMARNAGHMLANGFHPHPPERAHQILDPADYGARVRALRAAFRADTGMRHLFEALLDQLGADASDTFCDRLHLRIVPPGPAHQAPPADPLPSHRDTWASNVAQQVNLWAPVRPLKAANTLVLYPAHGRRAVDNTSAGWDLDDLRARRRAGGGDDYPRLPVAADEPDPATAAPVLIGPGDVLAFSGAHLHASAAAGGAEAVLRVSVDVRTASLADLQAGLGAPNVDGAAPRVAWDWFRRPGDGLSLKDAVFAPPPAALPGPA